MIMYVDPGYGAFILQGLIAAIVGSFFVARQKVLKFWYKLIGKNAGN